MRSFIFLQVLASLVFSSTPSFPGSMGSGAVAEGGRGGRVIQVTNLQDSGPGSLREALQAKGPRIVVFRVAGTIELLTQIKVSEPYLTLSGQTAPGGGILLSGKKLPSNSAVLVALENVHDVLIQYIRFRYGWTELGSQQGNCFYIGNNVSKVVVDHCSFSWAADQNITLWAGSQPYHDITFSNNISAEGLGGHSCGLIAGGELSVASELMDVDIHHNIFMNNENRNPLYKGKRSRIVSNLVYNWGWWAMGFEGGVDIDFISNAFIYGPIGDTRHREILYREDEDRGPPGDPSIHVKGNIAPKKPNPSIDDWPMVAMVTAWGRPGQDTPDKFRRLDPLADPEYPIVATSAEKLEVELTVHVGASRRLDSLGNWVPARDEVDIRLLTQLKNRLGKIPKNESEVGGFPLIEKGKPYLDEDRDGMADEWEKSIYGNLIKDGSGDTDGDGFTDLEEFLNGTSLVNTTQLVPVRLAPKSDVRKEDMRDIRGKKIYRRSMVEKFYRLGIFVR